MAVNLDVRIRRILVPLDGSRLAEAAVPVGISLARHLGARLTLLHVMERAAPATIHGEPHLTLESDAERYLAGVTERCRAESVDVESHVHPNKEGNVAQSIVDHAGDLGADLVLLSAHGKGGARRVLFGSVAQQVLRRGIRPVLMLRSPEPSPAAEGGGPPAERGPAERRRPADGDAAGFKPQRILVPLDGRAPSEAVLPYAGVLGRAYDAEIVLLVVVPTLATIRGERAGTALLIPTAATATLELEEQEAKDYADRLAAGLRAGGLRVAPSVGRGDPAQGVLESAAETGAGLIAMATHGKTGLEAVFSGSVASQVVARYDRPILLVHAPREEGD